MQDLMVESLQLQRIDLVARLIIGSDCSGGDKEMAVAWIAELTTDLIARLDEYDLANNSESH